IKASELSKPTSTGSSVTSFSITSSIPRICARLRLEHLSLSSQARDQWQLRRKRWLSARLSLCLSLVIHFIDHFERFIQLFEQLLDALGGAAVSLHFTIPSL